MSLLILPDEDGNLEIRFTSCRQSVSLGSNHAAHARRNGIERIREHTLNISLHCGDRITNWVARDEDGHNFNFICHLCNSNQDRFVDSVSRASHTGEVRSVPTASITLAILSNSSGQISGQLVNPNYTQTSIDSSAQQRTSRQRRQGARRKERT